jgi:hypothetical protein
MLLGAIVAFPVGGLLAVLPRLFTTKRSSVLSAIWGAGMGTLLVSVATLILRGTGNYYTDSAFAKDQDLVLYKPNGMYPAILVTGLIVGALIAAWTPGEEKTSEIPAQQTESGFASATLGSSVCVALSFAIFYLTWISSPLYVTRSIWQH